MLVQVRSARGSRQPKARPQPSAHLIENVVRDVDELGRVARECRVEAFVQPVGERGALHLVQRLKLADKHLPVPHHLAAVAS